MSRLSPSSGLERTERLLDLVPYLATHQGIALEELAREFSVSTSQITEDLTTLWMCGLPGYTPLELMDISFDTGVVSISNADTLARPRVLNRDEVLALLLGLETLQGDANPDHEKLAETISRLVSKLIALVDAGVQQKVQAGASALSTERARLERAIASRGAVKIAYHSISRDEVSHRVIHPLEFSATKGHDYVLAYCELTRSYRTFRLDRIIDVMSMTNPENPPPREASKRDDEKFTISLRIGSRLRDVVEGFNLDPTSIDVDPTKEIQVESFSADWALRQIMSLGGEVALEAPQELRNLLHERALRALKAYQA